MGAAALAELRHKGRGRPQRILLGSWPTERVEAVIRAVVYREGPDSRPGPKPIPVLAEPPSPAVREQLQFISFLFSWVETPQVKGIWGILLKLCRLRGKR